MKKYANSECWDLVENPQGEVYRSLVETLCRHSDKFYFITRKELKYNQEILKQFTPHLLETYQSKSWANTETKGPAATIHVIEANEETSQLLIKHANTLYDWVAPKLPEDLTFIKNNFTWFSCTTHEEFGSFSIRSDYYKNLIFGIQDLQLERVV